MRRISIWLGMLLFVVLANACSSAKEAEMETEDALSDFRSWVSNTTSNLADKTEEDWQRAKADFRTRTNELDQMEDNFSSEVKEEYKQLKQQFNDADSRYMDTRQQAQMVEWQSSLLGSYADLSTINNTNVREAYITFMENVRQNKGTWADEDWEMAKMVLETLNKRKAELSDIPTDTEVKIKALQMEFTTLETAADANDNN
ncbi:hypothetical protein [Pontibacter cellulosilyticus]|uniref:Uncharacterized protein n=1 Tax=Pontibacter cellulosilyticus TaxID=1720253 RepID=A0A923SI18_9BACT|nr:hypothetical protein [Pontibacter cellulosilyticus]MBC5992137.1 hypothetical protein [Pontibacter cellulosilyticus]